MLRNILITTLLLGVLTSCLKEDFRKLPFFTIQTDEPSFGDNGVVVLRGTLETITFAEFNNEADTEIGFLLSSENRKPRLDSLDHAEKLILEEVSSNTDFKIGIDTLDILRLYYVRAYARIKERIRYGDVEPFSVGVSVIIDPDIKVKNNTAELFGFISGLARRDLTADDHGFVFSDTEQKPEYGMDKVRIASLDATVKDGVFSTTLDSLDFNTRYYARAYVKRGEAVSYSESGTSFEIRDGWNRIQGLEGKRPGGLQEASGWVFGKLAFLGLGCAEDCIVQPLEQQVWQFDPTKGSSPVAWTPHSTFPFFDTRIGAVAFTIGNTLYAGLGQIPQSGKEPAYRNDFLMFDTNNPAEGWTEAPTFPGAQRAEAVAFVIGDTAYVGTGINTRLREPGATSGDFFCDFYAFTPAKGWWPVDSLPIRLSSGTDCNTDNGRERAVAFALNGRGYVGSGNSRCGILNDLWMFDPGAAEGKQWSYLTETPGSARKGAVAFTIAERQTAFFGTGFYLNNTFLTDFWAFDPDGNGEMGFWTPMTDFQGQGRQEAVGFAIGDKGYLGFGQGITFSKLGVDQEVYLDFWEFTPRENF
jgi:N-acetylneuraminic acid mutarotase